MPPSHRLLVQHIQHAGLRYAPHPTAFELRRAAQIAQDLSPWHPFASQEEWEVVKWIIDSNLSQGSTDKFLKLGLYHIVREAAPEKFPSFHNNHSFTAKLDSLPGPHAQWKLYELTIEGTVLDGTGQRCTETLDLWARDPNEVVAELMGNPEYKEELTYEPVRKFKVSADSDTEPDIEEIFDDIPSARWMWELQQKLPEGATIAPIIIASDKTQLSTFSGDKQAWPVYLTIGNIDKATRKCPSHRAMVLLGYLPTSKLQCFSTAERSLQGYRVFHYAMSLLLAPLVASGRDGINISCADGWVRRVFPILAAYLADHPEQCLVTCCKENRCPTCPIHPDDRGELVDTCYRDPDDTLSAIQDPLNSAHFEAQGLRHIPEPFWAKLPHTNIFTAIAPDLLHQLHKGVFKDHLVKWVSAVDEDELDARMMRIPPYHGLRVFKKGITGVQQWTGNEYRQMERVFIGALSGMHPSEPRVLTATRAILDFIFLAHLPSHSSSSLARLRAALETFHANKAVFVHLGVRAHFNIPKIHWLLHYLLAIVSVGPCDGLSTDISERLHIDYCKLGYRASNRREYIQQMIQWLTRREKVRYMDSYLRWRHALPPPRSGSTDPPLCHNAVFPTLDAIRAPAQPPGTIYTTVHPLYPTVCSPSVDVSATNTEQVVPASESDADAGEAGDNEEDDLAQPITSYNIARTPGFGYVRGAFIQTNHNAPQFARALHAFILTQCPTACIGLPDLLSATYGVFTQFTRTLPPQHPTVREHPTINRVRASPLVGQRGAYYDTVLVCMTGAALEGVLRLQDCRIAQVRAIFTLPARLQRFCPAARPDETHLVYIEWFTPFLGAPEACSKLYRVARSYTHRVRHAAIVPVRNIVRSCHLIPVWGERVDRTWTSDTVIEKATYFHLNEFSDHHMYLFVNPL
ncbi:hypothetical protein BD414DRAFT_580162 [Trametes punicea]|nr:hypothetical protein BD414DRAFT_580162 [Trametes punicea]